jgi:hypothetical protein
MPPLLEHTESTKQETQRSEVPSLGLWLESPAGLLKHWYQSPTPNESGLTGFWDLKKIIKIIPLCCSNWDPWIVKSQQAKWRKRHVTQYTICPQTNTEPNASHFLLQQNCTVERQGCRSKECSAAGCDTNHSFLQANFPVTQLKCSVGHPFTIYRSDCPIVPPISS